MTLLSAFLPVHHVDIGLTPMKGTTVGPQLLLLALLLLATALI